MAEAVDEAFRYGKLVLATITYNGDIFPFMRTYIENLTERSYQNRTIGLIENGSWAPAAARIMQGMFEKSKNITWLENNVKITSSLSEANEAEIDAMAEELCKKKVKKIIGTSRELLMKRKAAGSENQVVFLFMSKGICFVCMIWVIPAALYGATGISAIGRGRHPVFFPECFGKCHLIYKSTSDLAIYSAGYEECSPGYSYGPRIRSYHVIHFVLSGKGALHINQHVFQCQKGDVFIIPSGKVSFYQASSTDPWSYAWINFLGINSEMYIYQLMTSSNDIYVLHGLDTEKYKKCILEIVETGSSVVVKDGRLFNFRSIRYCLGEILNFS